MAGRFASCAADVGRHGGVADRRSGTPNPYTLDSATLPMPLVREFPDQPLPCSDRQVKLCIRVLVVPRMQMAEQSIILSVGCTPAERDGGA